jgi:transcriptional regulator of met regulon
MERIPKRKLRASQGDVRLGLESGRGRTQGAKNKATSAFAVAFMLAAQQVGEDGRGRNGVVGYLSRIARTEPKLFFRLYIHVAMDQNLHVAMDQNLSDDEEFQEDVQYETVEEAQEALREMGIDLTSLRGAAENGQEQESRRAATASEKDEALEEVPRPVPRRTRRP